MADQHLVVEVVEPCFRNNLESGLPCLLQKLRGMERKNRTQADRLTLSKKRLAEGRRALWY